jgi:hypothetical protein
MSGGCWKYLLGKVLKLLLSNPTFMAGIVSGATTLVSAIDTAELDSIALLEWHEKGHNIGRTE